MSKIENGKCDFCAEFMSLPLWLQAVFFSATTALIFLTIKVVL